MSDDDQTAVRRTRIALTMGDVAGVGPELLASALTANSFPFADFLAVGHPAILRRAITLIGSSVEVVEVDSPTLQPTDHKQVACWNPAGEEAVDVPPGRNDPRAGRAAYEYLMGAIDAALVGDIDAIVTAPLSKAALHAAGLQYPGHTEILAERCGVSEFAMMLHLPPGTELSGRFGLSVNHVTLHTSIRSVPDLLTTVEIQSKIRLMDQFLERIGSATPRIGVCALNPHAGEEGLFGDEELTVIAPAVERERAEGIQVTGPIPADALLRRAAAGEFDGVVAMYHDQGHIALKLLGFDRAVNVTLGLPIVRTSPSHGTAFDIAWKNLADPLGFSGAIETAIRLIPTETLSDTTISDTRT